MKNNLRFFFIAIALLSFQNQGFALINLGSAANFALFSTNGAVTNTGITHVTGNVGTNNGSSTGFGNVNGVMHDGDGTSARCASDLLIAYNQLNAATATLFPAPLLGNGQTLTPGIYSIGSASTLNLNLTLDAQGNSSAVFIIKIQGSFSTGAGAKVKLINGALACNVFWKIEGMVNMATGTSMKGTVIANNAAITMNVNDTLEGRAFSTTGAVTMHGVLVYTPIGCGSAVLTGPAAPALASAACYTIFSSNGSVTNSGVTHVTGDVGTNSGLTTGFDTLLVIGTVHPIPDASTAQCTADLHTAYAYLNTLPYDIQLLYPAQFGSNLVLTPHAYLLNAATVLTDTVFLDAQGNANAVFVMKINGAFSTGTYSCVKLINGTQSKNVFWKVEGAASINNYSTFCGTLIVNNGAITALNTGVKIDGRAFTTTGSITTTAITAIMPPGCSSGPPQINTQPIDQSVCAGASAHFSVIAQGTGLAYQWQKGNVVLTNGGHVSGANTAILTIDSAGTADSSSFYNVIVRGSSNPSDTSVKVALTVINAPVITSTPATQTKCAGSTVNFTITATGAITSYQWRKGTVNLIDGGNISGTAIATLTLDSVSASDAATDYNVITIGVCTNDTSGNVALIVNTAPAITTSPVDQTACIGNSANFHVSANGTNISYQWRKGLVNITNSGNTSGVNSNSLLINPVTAADAATNYNVITIGVCANDTSANVALIVNAAPAITTSPTDQTACTGNSANFHVSANGTNISYQWRKGLVNITNSGNTSGANSNSLLINPVAAGDAASNYNVITIGACANDTSANVALTVNTAPAITTSPADQTACVGNSANFLVSANGAGISYQWRKGLVNIVNSGNTSGANSNSLLINPVAAADAATNYNVVITGTCTPAISSGNAALTVCPTGIATIEAGMGNALSIYPNPFASTFTAKINDGSALNNAELKLYNILGEEMMTTTVTKQATEYKTSVPPGVYFYRLIANNKVIQAGKIVAQ